MPNPNVTTNYLIMGTEMGPTKRHHGVSNGSYVPVKSLFNSPSGTAPFPNTNYAAPVDQYFPDVPGGDPTNPKDNVYFLFAWVTDLDNNVTIYTASDLSTTEANTLMVGIYDTDTTINCFYGPYSLVGGKGSGIWLDAYNIDLSYFSNVDTFMTVLENNSENTELTNIANNQGNLDTDFADNFPPGSTFSIQAAPSISENGTQPSLSYWLKIVMNNTDSLTPVTSKELKPAMQTIINGETNEFWIAFYQTKYNPRINFGIGGIRSVEVAFFGPNGKYLGGYSGLADSGPLIIQIGGGLPIVKHN